MNGLRMLRSLFLTFIRPLGHGINSGSFTHANQKWSWHDGAVGNPPNQFVGDRVPSRWLTTEVLASCPADVTLCTFDGLWRQFDADSYQIYFNQSDRVNVTVIKHITWTPCVFITSLIFWLQRDWLVRCGLHLTNELHATDL